MPWTLPAAQKAVPAPVISSTPTSGFSPHVLIMVRSAGVKLSDSALRTSGRFSVMMATRSRIAQSNSPVPVSMVISVVVIRNFLHLRRHCEERSDEAIQFLCVAWIASRSLSSGAHSRDPLARNDGNQFVDQCCFQNFSTQGRNSISQVQALRGCCNTFQYLKA